MARLMIEFDQDEIRKELAYPLICETRHGAIWNTMRRKRAWLQMFTESEREKCSKIFAQAYSWYLVKGAPEHVVMSPSTYDLWQKLTMFCASL